MSYLLYAEKIKSHKLRRYIEETAFGINSNADG